MFSLIFNSTIIVIFFIFTLLFFYFIFILLIYLTFEMVSNWNIFISAS